MDITQIYPRVMIILINVKRWAERFYQPSKKQKQQNIIKNNDNDKNDDDGESERHCKTIVALPVR